MINYKPPEDESFTQQLIKLFPEKDVTIRTITIQVTEDCCMACTYCYQHHKTNNKMTFDTAKIFIDKLLNNEFEMVTTDNTLGIALDFIGGEPLMEIDLIEQFWNYFLTQMIKKKHPWLYFTRFSICSNGLLYSNKKIQNFLKKYSLFCSFTISIDGNKDLHDACRLDLQGNGTYDKVIKNVRHYAKNYNYNELPPTKMTISPDNINYLYDALINLINEHYIIIHSNYIFEKGWNYNHAKILYNELKKVADYLIYNNLYNKINISLFQEESFCPKNDEDNDNWCGGVADQSLAVNYQGNLYPCLRYMESSLNGRQKGLIIGNINTGYLSTYQHQKNYELISNITRRSQSTDECYYCPIATGCAWCSAYNYEEFGTPNKRATYICCMHQARSLINVYYWNTLYKYLNINKQFKMHLPKEEALKIIDEKEYNYLVNLNKGDN